jgi:hypothetical protein
MVDDRNSERCGTGSSRVGRTGGGVFELRDDRMVPVICPTCQNVLRDRSKHLCEGVTLHGVVFDIFALGLAPATNQPVGQNFA